MLEKFEHIDKEAAARMRKIDAGTVEEEKLWGGRSEDGEGGGADPGQPTQKMVNEHAATHLPYRSWCKACVMGKKRDGHHNAMRDEQKLVP